MHAHVEEGVQRPPERVIHACAPVTAPASVAGSGGLDQSLEGRTGPDARALDRTWSPMLGGVLPNLPQFRTLSGPVRRDGKRTWKMRSMRV